MRLRYTLPALADLAVVLESIELHSPSGARRVQRRIQSVVKVLLAHPFVGTETDDPTVRRMPTSPYPYLIYYEATDDEIVVARRATRRA